MIKKLAKMLQDAKEISIIAHERPDADSLGSCSAIYTAMLQLQKKVHFICKTKEIEKKYSFIPWCEKIHNIVSKKSDLVFVCDCASLKRIGFDIDVPIINIDHHKTNTFYGAINFVDEESISSTRVVYEVLKKLDVKINAKIATALYAGLVEDSDMFRSPLVDGAVFAFAKELIECGAKHNDVVKYLQKYSTLSHLRLLSRMFEQMELLDGASLSVFIVTREDFEATKARVEDCEEALERALELPTVKTSLLIAEKKDGVRKVSLRSTAFDVSKIAEAFGGGGHKTRAGCEFAPSFSIETIKEKIIKKVEAIEKKK